MVGVRGAVLVAAVVVLIAGLALAVAIGRHVVEEPRSLEQDLLSSVDLPADPQDASRRTFLVEEGQTAAEISRRLEAAGVIKSALLFRLMAGLKGVAGDLSAGEYELSPSMRPSEILAILTEARTKPSPLVTIPEGWRAEEIAERLAAYGVGSPEQFMEVVRLGQSDSPALAGRPLGASLEGYLFPDSYRIDSKTTPAGMVARMVEQFERRFTPEMREKAQRLGMSIHQVVTLASIIEREAVIPSERPLMAGVFYNRLKDGMSLDADPTVQYALASASPESRKKYGWWKTSLTAEDLQIDSPYNSYRNPGLPPGPICNPGLASLEAALEPAATEDLYFVARPDGSHAFARTLEEHNENVARYAPSRGG